MFSAERPVVLIIDANAITLTGAAAVLDMAGYECHCAQDGQAARKAVEQLALDLILCDVDLERESGLDLVRQLRKITGAEDVPVIFVSAGSGADIIQSAHEAGGFYYLRKPYDPDVVVDLVEKALWMPHLINTQIGSVRNQGSTTVNAPYGNNLTRAKRTGNSPQHSPNGVRRVSNVDG